MSDAAILDFARRHLAALDALPILPPLRLKPFEEGCVWLFGHRYPLKTAIGTSPRVWLKDDTVHVQSKEDDIEAYAAALERFCKQLLGREAQAIAEALQERHPALPAEVKIFPRRMETRFGSCTPSRRRVRVNLALIHYPRTCLEYVVAHEMSHLLHPDHSRAFYDTLAKLCPDFRAREKDLKRRHAAFTRASDKTAPL